MARSDRTIKSRLADTAVEFVAFSVIFAAVFGVAAWIAGEPWWVPLAIGPILAATLLVVTALKDKLSGRSPVLAPALGVLLIVVYGWTVAGFAWAAVMLAGAIAIQAVWYLARRLR